MPLKFVVSIHRPIYVLALSCPTEINRKGGVQLICLGQFDSSVTKKLLNKSVQGVAGLEGEILDTSEEKKRRAQETEFAGNCSLRN